MSERRRSIVILRRILTGLLVGLVGIIVALLVVINVPRSDSGGRTDALVVLGPSLPTRLNVATAMMRHGDAGALVVSAHPADTLWEVPRPCRSGQGLPYPVYCFDPTPSTTQGEARAVRDLMKEHGWTSVRVLTWKPQVERARLIFGRCIAGQLHVQETPQDFGQIDQLAYQGGAFVKALTQVGC